MEKLLLFVNIFMVILSATVFYLPFKICRLWGKESSVLFIAIPSSPDHIEQRQSLRDTWLQRLPDTSYKYKFIIGKNICNIHPHDRISEYSCERLNISLPKDAEGSTLFYSNSLKSSDKNVQLGLGFSFFVRHSIIIESLGVHLDALAGGSEQIVRIVLKSMPHNTSSVASLADSPSKISSVTFHSDSAFGVVNNKRYVYKKLLNPVLLPRGFEGMIMIEKVNKTWEEEGCSQLTNWEHGNLLTVLNVITKNSFEANDKQFCLLPSFRFTIKDIVDLEKVINQKEERSLEWNKYIDEKQRKLHAEAVQHNDMLFLDMIDVYRNLPQKMLLFYKWLFENFDVEYVLKTDDDTFVDILRIQEELEKPGDWDWWSCFRIGWPVKRIGKWQETFEYKKEIYPPFPSGAGYVLSERPLHWLKSRIDLLSVKYQGEDVAMGIWLQGMVPSRHVGEACHWACVEQCHPRSCNVMQLSVPAVHRLWRKYVDCGNRLCDCS